MSPPILYLFYSLVQRIIGNRHTHNLVHTQTKPEIISKQILFVNYVKYHTKSLTPPCPLFSKPPSPSLSQPLPARAWPCFRTEELKKAAPAALRPQLVFWVMRTSWETVRGELPIWFYCRGICSRTMEIWVCNPLQLSVWRCSRKPAKPPPKPPPKPNSSPSAPPLPVPLTPGRLWAWAPRENKQWSSDQSIPQPTRARLRGFRVSSRKRRIWKLLGTRGMSNSNYGIWSSCSIGRRWEVVIFITTPQLAGRLLLGIRRMGRECGGMFEIVTNE